METISLESHEIANERDLSQIRLTVKHMAKASALSAFNQTRAVTAASELARNALIYGGGGKARIEQICDENKQGIRVEIIDAGPGIADLEQAFTDGFTSGTGMGLGLSGARRLVDEFEIETEVGKGTKVVFIKWN